MYYQLGYEEGTLALVELLQQRFKQLIAWWNQQNVNNLVGLDIGDQSIKLLKIVSKENAYQIEHFAMTPLPPGAIEKNEIKNATAISNIIDEMFKKSGITTNNVALAISRSIAIIKNINIDNRLTPEEIESRAWIEANRHFPDLVGDIYLDFVIVGPATQDSSQLELVLIACRKEQIEPYLEILKQSSLKAKIVDVNSYALERALSLIIKDTPHLETTALLNLNEQSSTLIVIHAGKLIYAHDQSYDGYKLISQIQEYLKVEANKESTMDDINYQNILQENLSAHLRHTMHFFYSSRPHITIQQMVLSGDCATLPNLALFIQREIGIETILANPFIHMSLSPNINEKQFKSYIPTLMLCCGLALSKLPILNSKEAV